MTKRERVVVIASNSFSGAHFVDFCLENGHEVIGISRSPEYQSCMLAYKGRPGSFTFLQKDINHDLEDILEILDDFRPDYVINFAAQGEVGSSFRFPADHYRTNALGTIAFLNALKDRNFLKRYVHISTPEVYGSCPTPIPESSTFNPSSHYAASKASADLCNMVLFKAHGFPVVTIRATNVYGPHQQLYRIIPRTIIYARLGRKLMLEGGGIARKSYIHIRDVSRGEYAAMRNGRPGEIYHFSPTEGPISIHGLVETICDLIGKPLDQVAELGPDRPGQDAAYVIDSSKARRELVWKPEIEMITGIRQTIAWIDNNWDNIKHLPLNYTHKP